MNIADFLPKYPDIKYDSLNPYAEEDFNSVIFRKKEFYNNKLDRVESFPSERGMLTKHQKTIAHYMSSHTPYDRVLLVHSMGTGKTCSAIGAIEQIKNEASSFNGALILAKGKSILDNFLFELSEKCTGGQYLPANYSKLTSLEKTHRLKKMTSFYSMNTFEKFAKKIKKYSDNDIIEDFSNKIIVIDEVHNLRIQAENLKETLEMYNQYHRFVHLVKNCKIILLSGTPMKDSPDEIASVLNLLLPLDEQFPTGDEFLKEYMTEKNDVYVLKKSKREEFRSKLKGKVSSLREVFSNIERRFIGQPNYGNMKYFIVDPLKMSKFQSKVYASAYTVDKETKGIYISTRESSLFVFPDGSYGKKGFDKHIKMEQKHSSVYGGNTELTYKMRPELISALKGKNVEETLQNIRKCSVLYGTVIEKILNTKGNCFVYSSIVKGSGCIVFSLLLELVGFYKANGKEKNTGMRYALLTNKTTTPTSLKLINSRFNKSDNMHGDYIKLIIGSKAISEGFSFKNVILEVVNTPHWNYSETAQALARGIRLGSHNDLIKAGENPIVEIMQPVSIPDEKYGVFSIDVHMYQTSEIKDISIRGILRVLLEVSFDCALNYFRNHVEDGVDYSRECDYTVCNYTCDGVNMEAIRDGLQDANIDYSTYQLYYANPQISAIRMKIEQLFRNNREIDLNSIVENLKDEFKEEEILNAMHTIQEETGSEIFDYHTYFDIYSRTPVKKLMNKIEEIFRETFSIHFSNLVEQFEDSTKFEVITALRTLINDNIVIVNKYGLFSYIREENNTYFLVSNSNIHTNQNLFFTNYYVKYPTIYENNSFDIITDEMYRDILPQMVQRLCQADPQDYSKFLKSLDVHIQEMFIEASLSAKNQRLNVNKPLRKYILEYFKHFIKQVEEKWVSTLLKDSDGVLRCMDGDGVWSDCDSGFKGLIEKKNIEYQKKIRDDNEYKIIATYNPINESFCILDFEKENETRQTIIKERSSGMVDKRLKHSGKVCSAGGWKLPELLKLAVKRLKIDPPKDFYPTQSRKEMISLIKNNPKIFEIFTKQELDEADKDLLRRALYWGLSKKDNGNRGIKPICEALKEWFSSHGLLEIDNQCGVQGKKKEVSVEQNPTTKNFHIKQFIPNKDPTFKDYTKDIQKLMGECFGTKQKIDNDSNRWIIVFARKKIVGFVTIDSNNTLWNVCVAKNYRRQGIAKEAIKMATNFTCTLGGKNPTLLVNNQGKDFKKLIRMYVSFGFEIKRSDDKYTYMEHSC